MACEFSNEDFTSEFQVASTNQALNFIHGRKLKLFGHARPMFTYIARESSRWCMLTYIDNTAKKAAP
jgi:hypothetical protein